MNEFKKRVTENFDLIMDIAADVQGSTNQSAKVLSKFSSESESFGPIRNFVSINKALEYKYATSDRNNNKLRWNYDTNEGTDRFIWSGEFQKSASGSIFKNTNIQFKDVDGYMVIPTPYAPYDPSAVMTTKDNQTTDAFSIKLKFNNLPANKFVPLFGYVVGNGGYLSSLGNGFYRQQNHWLNPLALATATYRNSSKRYWEFNWNTRNWEIVSNLSGSARDFATFLNYPASLSYDQNNLYNLSTNNIWNNLPSVRNTIVWFLYAHDGNGNGMVVSTSGETNNFDPQNDQYRPSNKWYGQYNGYTQYQPPAFLDNWIASGKTLSELFDYYSFVGDSSTIGYYKSKRLVHIFDPYNTNKVDSNSSHDINPRATMQSFSPGGIPWLRTNTENKSGSIMRNGFNNSWWGGYNHTINRGSSHLSSFSTGLPGIGQTMDCPFQIVSFGPMNNSTLSSLTQLNINAHKIGLSNRGHYGYGMNSDVTSVNAGQVVFDGTFENTGFSNVHGPNFYDNYRHRYYYTYRVYLPPGNDYFYGVNSYKDWYAGPGPNGIVLRPTVLGDGEIHEVNVGSYDNQYTPALIGGSVGEESYGVRNFYTKSPNAKLLMPEPLDNYDSVKAARQNPSIIQDLQSNWTNEGLMLDGSLGTKAQCTKPGIGNALFIPLDASSLGSIDTDALVENITLRIRNAQLFSIRQYKLRFSITDSNKAPLMTSGGLTAADVSSPDVIPIEYGESFPDDVSFFDIVFNKNESAPVTYGQIQNGFLMLWVESMS